MIIAEGPETVAAVYLEPVQNAGGCLVPPEGYFQRVREICDRHGVLLVSDEVICAFGRLGDWFGPSRLGYQPDMLTFAKGLTSGYAPLGGVLVSDRLAEPFLTAGSVLPPRHHLRRPPGELRRRAGQPRRDGARGPPRSGAGPRGRVPLGARPPHRPPDRPRGARDGLLLRHRAHEERHRLQRRRVRLADPRLPVEPAPRARPDLSGRRPGRPGHPALAVAGRRPRGVRRDLRARSSRCCSRPGRSSTGDASPWASPRRSRRTSAAWPSPPTACGRWRRTASRCSCRRAPGEGASIPDDAYVTAGAEIVADAAEVWARAGMVVKVKEPQESEFAHLRDDLTLFTYLHLAAYPKVAEALCDAGTTGIAYETVMRADGALPLLAPMSEVAGRLAVQAGARFLEAPQGGRGVLLGGAPGVQPARVVVHRRRQRRVELGVDRGRHGGRGQPPRQEPRPPALRRPDPQGPHHHARVEPRHRGALHRRGRPRHRRRARGRWPGPRRDHRADGRDDEARAR